MKRRYLVLPLLLACSGYAHAQTPSNSNYPNKPIRIVIPYPPGGGTDIVMRPVSARLSERLGQPVIVDNRGGATGTIGSEAVAHAAPDGYTLLAHTNAGITILPHLNKKLPYDPIKDFAPVTLAASSPYVLVVNPKIAATSVAQIIALARAHPGELNYASSGNGASTHLAGLLFCQMAGIKMVHIPYKGSGPATTELLAGQVQMRFSSIPPVLPHVRTGRLRALAVTGAKRFSLLPDLPTVADTVPGFEVESWYGVFAPAGTPPAIIRKLNAEFAAALNLPEIKALLATDGSAVVASSPEKFGAIIRAEFARWAPVVKESGAKID
jgi:tripartite-type tricarboxylate transporter receptor subunit TctC